MNRKTEPDKVATQIAKALSLLSNLSAEGRYAALVQTTHLLTKQGYGSIALLARSAADAAYRG